MLVLRHRSASSRLDALWEFDPARKVIDVVIRLGSEKPRAFTLPVCAPDKPRIWAHPILRLDGESWRILPSVFVPLEAAEELQADDVHGIPIPRHAPILLVPRDCREPAAACALHDAIGLGSHLVLTNAPPSIDIELAELSL